MLEESCLNDLYRYGYILIKLCSYLWQILQRLTRLCVQETAEPGAKKSRKHEQRLLRNMNACAVVLELLQIPYDKVNIREQEKSAFVCEAPHDKTNKMTVGPAKTQISLGICPV